MKAQKSRVLPGHATVMKNEELIILEKAKQDIGYPIDLSQSWRHTTYDPITKKLKYYPIFYIRQTLFHKVERISLALGIEMIKLKKIKLTGDMKIWLMENDYAEVVRDLLYS